jgi:hypothetical protein
MVNRLKFAMFAINIWTFMRRKTGTYFDSALTEKSQFYMSSILCVLDNSGYHIP